MANELPKAVMEFSLLELQFLAQLVDYKRQEPHWHPTYLELMTAVGRRLDAEIEKIKTPHEEAEILRKARILWRMAGCPLGHEGLEAMKVAVAHTTPEQSLATLKDLCKKSAAKVGDGQGGK